MTWFTATRYGAEYFGFLNWRINSLHHSGCAMDGEYPLWRLAPDMAARLIILDAVDTKPRRLHMEHKRTWQRTKGNIKHTNPATGKSEDPLIRGKAQNKPRSDELPMLNKAADDNYWKFYFLEEADAYPRIGVAIGPLMQNGAMFTCERVQHPLGAERQREPLDLIGYSKGVHDAEVAGIQHVRAVLMENFILGQRKEGPYIDGIIFKRADDLLLDKIRQADHKLRLVAVMIENKRLEKRKAMAQSKKELWVPIGNDEARALAFKHRGFTVRKVEVTHPYYELKSE